jgi:hypothetical protein
MRYSCLGRIFTNPIKLHTIHSTGIRQAFAFPTLVPVFGRDEKATPFQVGSAIDPSDKEWDSSPKLFCLATLRGSVSSPDASVKRP